jgi:site-specific DNA-cytosine methylase
MKVLVACEFSGIVREAFIRKGHNAWSCDLLNTEIPGPHIKDNVLKYINDGWDLMIAHPPCTYLSNAGIKWFNERKYGDKAKERKRLRNDALGFVMKLINSNIPKIAIENPTGWINSHYRKPDQIIQPWEFGERESKRTCLWLKGLPLLQPTEIVKPKIYAYYKRGKNRGKPIYGNAYLKFSVDRWKDRSRTFPGIARAMAEQWGN